MKFFTIILIFIMGLSAKGLTQIQQANLKFAYDIGKTFSVDNIHFGHSVSALMLNETNAKKSVVGDKYRFKHYIFINNSLRKIKYTNKKIYYYHGKRFKVITKKTLNPYNKRSFGYYQFKVSTAKSLIKRYSRLVNYKHLLLNDNILINALLNDLTFSATLAGVYLVDRYNAARRLNLSNPRNRAISAYNGGWNNNEYLAKFRKHIKIVLFLGRQDHWS